MRGLHRQRSMSRTVTFKLFSFKCNYKFQEPRGNPQKQNQGPMGAPKNKIRDPRGPPKTKSGTHGDPQNQNQGPTGTPKNRIRDPWGPPKKQNQGPTVTFKNKSGTHGTRLPSLAHLWGHRRRWSRFRNKLKTSMSECAKKP